MDDMSKAKEFKKELGQLLKKYDAAIWVSLEGDTHGIYAEELWVEIDRRDYILDEQGTIDWKKLGEDE